MLSVLCVLLIGGTATAAAKLVNKWLVDEQKEIKLVHTGTLPAKLASLLQRSDNHYQEFFQKRVDPLLEGGQRSQQRQTLAIPYSNEEADFNRRIGYAVANATLAILGAVFYIPLSWVSAAGLICMMFPLFKKCLQLLFREKRLGYQLIAILWMLTNLSAGYFVISTLSMVVFFSAFKIATRAEANSNANLVNTFILQPPSTLWIQRHDNVEIEIEFSELQIGDIVVISAGQIIPVDGFISRGVGSVDQHILTGEAQPIEKASGDQVFANTLLLTGKLYIRVEHNGSDTAVAQIGAIIDNITSNRLEQETRSQRLADQTVLPILAASGLALLTVGPVGAVAITNVGVGSTLFISGPLNMLSHLNIASRHGILIKNGRSLEKMHEVDTVVFDKTGTLTMGEPELRQIHCCGTWSEKELLALAAIAEHRQSHPVAKAILTAANQSGLTLAEPDEAAYNLGFGVQVKYQGNTIQVGSQRFMEQAEITISNTLDNLIDRAQTEGGSLIFVAVNEQLAGVLVLQDQLRPETKELVDKLHQRGLKLCILSGDHLQPTQHLAQRLGIDEVFAEVLPEGKVDLIRELQAAGHSVCFVGDGINDAIALHQADVSVSLLGATTIATDSAGIVLMDQSLQHLDELFTLGDSFNKNLEQTTLLAFVPGSILIAGVFFLHFGVAAALVLYTGGLATTLAQALSPPSKIQREKHTSEKFSNYSAKIT